MKRAIPIIALLLVAGWGASTGSVQLKYQRVAEDQGDIVLEWEALVESEVHHYVLARRTPYSRTNSFDDIAEIQPQGANKPYQYRDSDIYKVAVDKIEYRLAVVYANGVREEFPLLSVNYTPTAVRRTWGSIKAMFQ